MIEEQIKKLREEAERQSKSRSMTRRVFSRMFAQAADTIESLSAKLQAANMERSADCGGWIPCKERLPEIEQTVLLSLRSLDVCVGFRANSEGYFYSEGEGYVLYENVLAWRIPPEPYHEP